MAEKRMDREDNFARFHARGDRSTEMESTKKKHRLFFF